MASLDDLISGLPNGPQRRNLEQLQKTADFHTDPSTQRSAERQVQRLESDIAKKQREAEKQQAAAEKERERAAREVASAEKAKNTNLAKSMTSQALAFYTDSNGVVRPITAPNGRQLQQFDKSGTFWDPVTGEAYRRDENGNIALVDPGTDGKIVMKDGSVYSVVPGMPWKWEGYDAKNLKPDAGLMSEVAAKSKALSTAASAAMGQMSAIQQDINSDRARIDEIDEALFTATPEQRANLETERAQLVAGLDAKLETQAQAELNAYRAQAERRDYAATSQAAIEANLAEKRALAVDPVTLTNTGRLPSISHQVGLGSVSATPRPTDPMDPLDGFMSSFYDNYNAQTVAIAGNMVDYANQVTAAMSDPTVSGSWTSAASLNAAMKPVLDADFAGRTPVPIALPADVAKATGLTHAPETWFTEAAMERQLAAKEAGQMTLQMPEGYRLEGGVVFADKSEPLKVFGVELPFWQVDGGEGKIGTLSYDTFGVPYLTLDAGAAGISPSFESGNYYRGIPEYSAPPADWLAAQEAAKATAAGLPNLPGLSDKANDQLRADAMAEANLAWSSKQWSAIQTRDFLDQWQVANDAQRADMIALVDPKQALLAPADRRLDTGYLYEQGFISKQDARLIENVAYGIEPGIPSMDEAFNAWVQSSQDPAAVAMRNLTAGQSTGKSPWETILNTVVPVTALATGAEAARVEQDTIAAAKAAFVSGYMQSVSGTVDFDRAAYTAQRDAFLANDAPWWEQAGAWVSSTAQMVAGSSLGILTYQIPALLGIGGGLSQDQKEVIGLQTAQSLENMGEFLTDRLTINPAELWSGVEGIKVTGKMDEIFASIDAGTMTPQELTAKAGELSALLGEYHAGSSAAARQPWENDVLSAQNEMSRMLAAYIQTGDPAYQQAFRNMAFNSAFERETQQRAADYASLYDQITPSAYGSVFLSSYLGAGVAPLTETGIELATTLVSLGASKVLTTGAKWATAAETAGDTLNFAQRAFRTIETSGQAMEDWFGALGMRSTPVSQFDDLWNTGVTLVKNNAVEAFGEGFEEVVAAMGQGGATLGDAISQGLTGMAGGMMLGGANMVPALIVTPIQEAAVQRANEKALQGFVNTYNAQHLDSPITVEIARQAQAFHPADTVSLLQTTISGLVEQRSSLEKQLASIPQIVPDGRGSTTLNPAIADLTSQWNDVNGRIAAAMFDVSGVSQNAIRAVQEINGLPSAQRDIANAAVLASIGAPLTPAQVQILTTTRTQDNKPTAWMHPSGRLILTDAFRVQSEKSLPFTAQTYFKQTEAQQMAKAAQAAQRATATPPPLPQDGQVAKSPGSYPGAESSSLSPATTSTPAQPATPAQPGASPTADAASRQPAATAPETSPSNRYAVPITYLPRGSAAPVTVTRFFTAASPTEASAKRDVLVRSMERIGVVQSVGDITPAESAPTAETKGASDPQIPENRAFVPAEGTPTWKTARNLIGTAAAAFGYKLVDTGIDIGIRDRWGNPVNLGTQIYDKLNPGSEIGQWIDKVSNSPFAAEIADKITAPGLHRVWFGHDFGVNLGLIVEKFGWQGVPEYIGQLLKDSLTKSGIPFPGVELLVRSGVVSDRVATDWLSTNIGEVFGGGVAFFGTYKLLRAAQSKSLTRPRVAFATLGVGIKLVAGVWTAQPFLILSGLADAAVLITNLGQIREAFSKAAEVAKTAPAPAVIAEQKAKKETQASETLRIQPPPGPPESAKKSAATTPLQPNDGKTSASPKGSSESGKTAKTTREPSIKPEDEAVPADPSGQRALLKRLNQKLNDIDSAKSLQGWEKTRRKVIERMRELAPLVQTFQNANAKLQLRVPGKNVNDMLRIETVTWPDGVVEVRESINVNNSGYGTPFFGSYTSEAEAVADAKKRLASKIGGEKSAEADKVRKALTGTTEAPQSTGGQTINPIYSTWLWAGKSKSGAPMWVLRETPAGEYEIQIGRDATIAPRAQVLKYAAGNPFSNAKTSPPPPAKPANQKKPGSKKSKPAKSPSRRAGATPARSDAAGGGGVAPGMLETALENTKAKGDGIKKIISTKGGDQNAQAQEGQGRQEVLTPAEQSSPAGQSAPGDSSATVPESLRGRIGGAQVIQALAEIAPWIYGKNSPFQLAPRVFVSPDRTAISDKKEGGDWSPSGVVMAAYNGRVLVDQAQLTLELNRIPEANRKQWLEAAIDEELEHHAQQKALTYQDLVDLWNDAPEAVQQRVIETYHAGDILASGGDWRTVAATLNPAAVAQEFLRMYRQAIRSGATTEQIGFQLDVDAAAKLNPTFAARLAKVLGDIARFMRDELTSLLTGEARVRFDAAIARIEAKRAEIEALLNENAPTSQQPGPSANPSGPDTEANRSTGPPVADPARQSENVAFADIEDAELRAALEAFNAVLPAAAVPARRSVSTFESLPSVTQEDIAANVFERVAWWQEANKSWRWDEAQVAESLADQADPIDFPVFQAEIEKITGFRRNTSPAAVKRFVEQLSKSEAPPILLDGNQFVDGGHRLEAYRQAGRKTIPAVDIGPLLRLDWAKYMGQDPGTQSVPAAAVRRPVVPAAMRATTDPAFISAAAQLSDVLWARGYNTPAKFAEFLHGRFGERITPKVLSQVWNLGANTDPDAAVNWSKVHAEAIRPTVEPGAMEAATHPKNDIPQPTVAQQEAGNYKKGHVVLSGLDISIENPAGSLRSGVDREGQRWQVQMKSHYGYVRRTEGRDGDHLDVFIKPGTPLDWTGKVFVVNQLDPAGKFDEHKVVIGAADETEARKLYRENYENVSHKLIDSIAAMPIDTFKTWAREGDLTKPAVQVGEKKHEAPWPHKISETEVLEALAADEALLREGGVRTFSLAPGLTIRRSAGAGREADAAELLDLFAKSYAKIGFQYKTTEDLLAEDTLFDAILDNSGSIVAANIRKLTPHGYKTVASGSNGSPAGKLAWRTSHRQLTNPFHYAELSDVPRIVAEKENFPSVPASEVGAIIGKTITPSPDDLEYSRKITGLTHPHVKRMFGSPLLWKTRPQPNGKPVSSEASTKSTQPSQSPASPTTNEQNSVKNGPSSLIPTSSPTISPNSSGDLSAANPLDLVSDWWDNTLTQVGRAKVLRRAGLTRISSRVTWNNLSPENQRKISDLRAKELAESNSTPSTLPNRDSVRPTTATPQRLAADAILSELRAGNKLGWRDLFLITNKAWGGTMAKGTYTVKDAYDALELAVNLLIAERNLSASGSVTEAEIAISGIEDRLRDLPTQTKRTKEADDMQQFSTPPHFAYVANWVADIKPGDVMLESSAGIGGLAVFAKNAGATVIANELSPRRRAFLAEMGFDHLLGENAEQLHAILEPRIAKGELPRPTVVVMNPPFSNAAKSGKKGRTIIGAQHVEEALKVLAPGGRLVAIVGEGMGMTAPTFRRWWERIAKTYNVRANILVDGKNYFKYGTTFSNRLLVIDKTGPTTAAVREGSVDEISELPTLLEGIRNDRTRSTSTQPAGAEASQPGGGAASAGDSSGAATGDAGNSRGQGGQSGVSSSGPLVGFDSTAGPSPTSGDGTPRRPAGEPDGSRGGDSAGVVTSGPESGPAVGDLPKGTRLEFRPGDPVSYIWGGIRQTGTFQGLYPDGMAAVTPEAGGITVNTRVDSLRPLDATWISQSSSDPAQMSPDALSGAVTFQASGKDSYVVLPDGNRWLVPGTRSKAKGLAMTLPAVYQQAFMQQKPVSAAAVEQYNLSVPAGYTREGDLFVFNPSAAATTQAPTAETTGLTVTTSTEGDNRAIENEDDVFALYKPAKVRIPGAQKHLAPLVESAAMASVVPPDPTYTPNLPTEVITEGRISETSLENIVYAGQAHQQILPNGTRRGYLIGDGTGVGKGRQIAGIIMDNMRQGRTKAVWLSEKEGLMDDAKRDVRDVGMDPEMVTFLGKTKKGAKVEKADGIIFSTYSTLKGGHQQIIGDDIKAWWKNVRAGKLRGDRLAQIAEWLGEDFDGAIMLDEAHNAGNAIPLPGKRGVKKASATGIAVVDLQKVLPKARIVYVSATAATEVENLSYADRLGIWGEGTPFPNKLKFFDEIRAGGISAMEIVARDLKAQGLYLARSISYKGVEFSRLTQNLTPEQTALYNTIAEAWQVVLSDLDETMGATGANNNAMARSAAMSAFWGAQQRFFNQLLTAMELPAVLADMEKELAAGNSSVLQIVNTNEATQNRQIAQKQTEAGGEKDAAALEDLDLSPRDILLQYLDKSFPTLLFEQVADPNNPESTIWQVARDAEGNAIQDPAAVAKKQELMDRIATLDVPGNPLEQIFAKFGEENIAEVTGRTQRVVSVKQEDGSRKTQIQRRSPSHRKVEADEFQKGDRRILIFSDAGGTGFSFHASNRAKNRQRRVHYLVQAGWRADKALQGFGRTHRTDQASAPVYILAETNIAGHKRFISTIARRLAQLGALTTGERKGKSGIFTETDNLESEYAEDAIKRLIYDLHGDRVPGYTLEDFSRGLGFNKTVRGDDGELQVRSVLVDPNTRQLLEEKIPDIPQFLNRVLALPLDEQNQVFDLFMTRLESRINAAMQDGTYDPGTQSYRAEAMNKLTDEVVFEQPGTGSKTRLLEVEEVNPVAFTQFDEITRLGTSPVLRYVRNRKSGRVYALKEGAKETDSTTGAMVDTFRRIGTRTFDRVRADSVTLTGEESRYEELAPAQAAEAWDAEIAGADKLSRKKVNFLVGAMLPVWDRIKLAHPKIYRFTTSAGEPILGVLIPPKEVPGIRQRMGAKNTLGASEVFDLVREEGGTFELANGWTFRRVKLSGEDRIELTGMSWDQQNLFTRSMGGQMERVQFRPRFFIPSGEVMQRVLDQSPLVTMNGQEIASVAPLAPPAAAARVSLDPAAAALFTDNLPLATWFADRFRNIRGVEFDDILQEARIGLWRAAERFDAGRGIPFGGYASTIIRNRLKALYNRQNAKRLDEMTTLDAPIPGAESGATAIETIADRVEMLARPEDVVVIREEVAKLPAKPRQIWEGFLAGRTWESIGQDFGFSKQRAQQLAAAAGNTLRAALAKRGIANVDDVFPQRAAFQLDRLPERRAAIEDEENLETTPTLPEETPDGEPDGEAIPAAAVRRRGPVDVSTPADTLNESTDVETRENRPASLGSGNQPLEGQGRDDVGGGVAGAIPPQRLADAYVAWLGGKTPAEARRLTDPERAFTQFAQETGRVLPASTIADLKRSGEEGGGEEHWVFLQGDRVWKVLQPGKGYPAGGDPLEYILRLARMNAAVPQLDVRFAGVLPGKGKAPRIVTTMTRIVGQQPTKDALHTWLQAHGWDEVGSYAWQHTSGVEMADAAPDNFIQVDDDIVPIDVWFSGDVTTPMFLPEAQGDAINTSGEQQTSNPQNDRVGDSQGLLRGASQSIAEAVANDSGKSSPQSVDDESRRLISSPRRAANLNEAREAAKSFVGTPLTNRDDKSTATLSGNSLGKILSQSAVGKSANVASHAMAVANADALFQDAIRVGTRTDRDGDPNIRGIHRYFAPMVLDGEVYAVKLTVKEFARPSEGKALYSIEAISEEKVKPAGNWVASISNLQDWRIYTPQAGFEEKLRAKFAEVNTGATIPPAAAAKMPVRAEDEITRIEVEAGRARAYREDHKRASVENNGIGVQEFMATYLAGRIDKVEFFAPGAKAIILDDRRQEALVAATINSMMDTMRQDIQKAFGYPKFWQKQHRRLQQFLDEILPTAARLEVSHLDDEGNFVFRDFQMRAGVMPYGKMRVMGWKEGDQIFDNNQPYTLGPEVAGKGHVLLRDMPADVQRVIYDDFHDKFPESAHYLDRFIMPGQEEARYMGPAGTMTAEFNRHALRDLFNQWPQELRDLFGPMPLPDLPYVEGYTPDVAESKTLVAMISSLLRKFRSGARKFKAGDLRESGNVKNLFDGFNIRAMEAHREKIRLQTRQKLIDAAAVPESKIPLAERAKYVPLDNTFTRLIEAVKLARGLDPQAFPALSEALNPGDARLMARILGDAYRLRGRGLMIHKEVERELMLGVSREVTNNALTRILAGLLERFNAGLLATPFTTITNWASNEVIKAVRTANRLNFAVLSAVTGDTRAMKLGAYEFGYLLRGFITDRFPQWQRQRIGKIVPRELFDDQTQMEAFDIDPTLSVWDQVKRLNLGGAFLKAVQYGEIDIRQKQQLAYAAYNAHAAVAADLVPGRDYRDASGNKISRRQWMRDWMQNAPAEIHRDVYLTTVLYLMDYQNVPAWLDANQSNNAMAQLMKRAIIPFAKWPYNMARQFKRFTLDSAFDLVLPGRTKEQRNNGAANLLVMAGLAALGAWLVGSDDDEDKLLGSNIDEEGKLLEAAFRTGNRINISRLARIIFAHGMMRGASFTVTDAAGRENDLWWRYRNYPYLKEAILMGMAARGDWEAFNPALSDMWGEYVSLGLLAKVLGLSAFDKDKTVPFRTTEAAYDLATAGVLPPPWRQLGVKLADPVMRKTTPSETMDYAAGAADAIKVNTPFLSRSVPSTGNRIRAGFAPFSAEDWFRTESSAVQKDPKLSIDEKVATTAALREQAQKYALPAFEQRDIFLDAGLPVELMDMSKRSSLPAASHILELNALGVGSESIAYVERTDKRGRHYKEVSYPDPATIRVASPARELTRFFGGLNLMEVPRQPLSEEEFFGK